jgi:23S rRNA (cytidine1920-2'-O)/16S rRNA (cytidine1409-2'-O)-methyltransferase
MSDKIRLDHLLVERGLAPSGSQAQALILAGEVLVEGEVARKPGTRVRSDAQVEVRAHLPYASRGGLKLAAALDAFAVSVQGTVCADVGASTGGFTDCLLQRGASRVYAIDVGYGQLAWSLRQDARVIVMERTNVRYLEQLPEPVHVVTIDISFISLTKVLPVVVKWLDSSSAPVLALVKPQFEAGRAFVERGGVVRDPRVHRQVLEQVAQAATDCGLHVWGLVRSPITGPAGNVEFFMHLRQAIPPSGAINLPVAIERALG